MTKTAMQQHLEWLKARIVVTEQMEQELLELEKEQIVNAYWQGTKDWSIDYFSTSTLNKVSEKYYNETFKID
jgi:hypothetical protein